MKNVLITGGSEGLGLARRFVNHGATVLVTGRSKEKLDRAAAHGLKTFVSDVGLAGDREALAAHVRREFGDIDCLINNAGSQRRVSHAEDRDDWCAHQLEIDTLLSGPVHLNALLIPTLVKRASTIVNVTSGGAYVPQVFAPLYSACKAALHNHTVTLRDALKNSSVRVVELIPPAVQTALSDHGAPLEAFCDAVFTKLLEGGHDAIGFGPTEHITSLGQTELQQAFEASAARFTITRFA